MNANKLQCHLPGLVLAEFRNFSQTVTDLQAAHFLSQCDHESAGFKHVEENLNYSADGLNKIFGKYFRTVSAASYARQPEKIANRVYANRLGNGNENSGDGWRYRGRGYIQLTGKDNYQAFSEFIGTDCVINPDFVANKYPLSSAYWFFNYQKIWPLCNDKYEYDVQQVTKKVNGGLIGIDDRIRLFNKYCRILGV